MFNMLRIFLATPTILKIRESSLLAGEYSVT